MAGYSVKLDGTKIIVTIDTLNPEMYQTEKGNWNVATTKGFARVEGMEGVSLSMNVIAKTKPTAPRAPAKPQLRKSVGAEAVGK